MYERFRLTEGEGMNKLIIMKDTDPIKFGSQIGMIIDELDTGGV